MQSMAIPEIIRYTPRLWLLHDIKHIVFSRFLDTTYVAQRVQVSIICDR